MNSQLCSLKRINIQHDKGKSSETLWAASVAAWNSLLRVKRALRTKRSHKHSFTNPPSACSWRHANFASLRNEPTHLDIQDGVLVALQDPAAGQCYQLPLLDELVAERRKRCMTCFDDDAFWKLDKYSVLGERANAWAWSRFELRSYRIGACKRLRNGPEATSLVKKIASVAVHVTEARSQRSGRVAGTRISEWSRSDTATQLRVGDVSHSV